MNLPPPAPVQQASSWAPPAAQSAPSAPLTVRAFLADQPSTATGAAAALSMRSALEPMPPAVRRVADKEVHRACGEALEISFADVVGRAWKHHHALTAAAQRTKQTGREVVTLADHTIASVHQPQITVAIDGADVATIHLTVELSVRMVGVAAVVEQAKLIALESGAAIVTATLKVNDQPVANKAHQFDVQHVVPLDRPVALLPDE
ncbi:MAG: hypothetical protein Q7V57_05870 [Actinomycetota bacterium]|nr:hypothetical protein [Actinomycetota bacterium]